MNEVIEEGALDMRSLLADSGEVVSTIGGGNTEKDTEGIPVQVRYLQSCLNGCNALVGEDRIKFSVAREIAQVIVAIEDELRLVALWQKNILGDSTTIMNDDPDRDDKINELNKINEHTIYLQCEPIDGVALEKTAPSIWPPALGALLRSRLIE